MGQLVNQTELVGFFRASARVGGSEILAESNTTSTRPQFVVYHRNWTVSPVRFFWVRASGKLTKGQVELMSEMRRALGDDAVEFVTNDGLEKLFWILGGNE